MGWSIGVSRITNAVWGVPYSSHRIIYTRTLFYLFRPICWALRVQGS